MWALLLLIILIYIIYRDTSYFTTIKLRASDGSKFRVVSKYTDANTAVELISQLNKFAQDLIDKMYQVYIKTPGIKGVDVEKGIQITSLLAARYNGDILRENEPTSANMTSFTRGKADEIAICLREKNTGSNKFHDIQLIKFVFLHELAHVVSVSYDHIPEFWENFKFLLEFAEKYGLYQSSNYGETPVYYCGLRVEFNPKFNPNIKSYFY